MKEVVISTSRLNCYGYRVLTEGIDLEQYSKNPLLLWMHTRPMRGTTDDILPIGKMENLRVEGDQLIGTPVFDMDDPFAARIANKWEKGILKMSSAGLEVIEESDAPEHIVAGQRYATVTRCKLLEVSIVDIGANDDALVLMRGGERVELKKETDVALVLSRVGEVSCDANKSIINSTSMKDIAKKLGLPEVSDKPEVLAAIGQLQEELRQLKLEQGQANERALMAVVEQAVVDGKITADKKHHFVELGKKAGVAALTETLKLMGGAVRPSDVITPSTPMGGAGYAKLSEVPVEELAKLRKEQPSEYRKLYKAEYGMEPKIDE